MSEKKNPHQDLVVMVDRLWMFVRYSLIEPILEIYRGASTGSLPVVACWIVGITLSGALLFHIDDTLLRFFGSHPILIGRIRGVLGIVLLFSGFLGWAFFRVGLRERIKKKLKAVFINASLETKLKETPEFVVDVPLDEFTRKLRLRGRGLPVQAYKDARNYIEAGLNVSLAKIENPSGNREYVDIVYTTEKMPDLWLLDNFLGYKDFSFPIGLSLRGEITASFKVLPHFLIAGESGGGKSTFIRMLVTVILINNQDVEIYFIDFKRGMENQVFEGFDRMTLIDDAKEACAKLQSINSILDSRMKAFRNAKARNLEMYNSRPSRKGPKEKRIIVVVDEVSEMVPTMGNPNNSDLGHANSIMNRIARMGRAVGINLVIGVQKPDAKNLDTVIKANTPGVVCFPVSHFNQSMVVLGNGRAAELNSEIKGRAIWKQGADFIEVQTPLLTEKEVYEARERITKYWEPRTSRETAKETNALSEKEAPAS
ncbi:FtsK/SpoIIIE domain-containing protein [Bdellovibrio sp.]|uniref:FtsK/SpoIIIE domain-containing protein n=1 Tax=Bdellovibrio sp. TaxID=28201 RepID=UPI001A605CC7|nr:MAG: hypothetical protein BroJett040_25050 [Oligoflexia bacterium]